MTKKKTIAAVAALCAASLAVGASSAGIIESVTSEIRPDFSIVVDGQEKTFKNANGDVVYPMLYEGTTYLPIRAIGEIMGKTVYWYENEKKIELKEAGTTVTDADVIITDSESTDEITLQSAKEIALEKAGASESDAEFTKMKLDIEDGIRCYELKFVVGTVKYSADISAADGTVLSWEVNNIGNSSTSSSEDLIGIETAKEIALERVGLSADDVTFIKEKQKLDDGIQVYEIEFCSGATEYDIKINASSGEILEFEEETETSATYTGGDVIGIEKAKQIALEKAGLTEDEVKFTEASFEIEKGNRIYEIEFRKGELEYSAEISAEDGTIISWEID